MAEAKGVLAGNCGRSGRTSSLRTSAVSGATSWRSVGESACDRAAVEDAPLDRAALEHVALGRIELVEPRGQQRLDRRRHGDGAVGRVAHERDHLLDEERVPFRRVEDPRAQRLIGRRAVEQARDERVGVAGRERLEQHRRGVQLAAAPVRPPVEQLRPRHAEQEDRRVAAEVGDVIDEIEERLLAPVDVVQHDDERPLRQQPPRAASASAQAISSTDGDDAAVAEHRLEGPGRGRVQAEVGEALLRRGAEQLLEHLDDRPVGDPLAVGETATRERP